MLWLIGKKKGSRMQESRKWSEEDTIKVKEMWLDYKSGGAIATKLGRSRNSIIGKLNRMKVTRPEKGSKTKSANSNRPPVKWKRSKVEEPDNKLNVKMKDINNNQCRWPEGHMETGMTFCGRETAKGKSYCPEHTEMSINRAKPRKKKKEEGS